MLGQLGAISLKNLTKHKEVRKLEKELNRLIIKYYQNNISIMNNQEIKVFLEKNECNAKACSSVSFELSALSIGVPESTD